MSWRSTAKPQPASCPVYYLKTIFEYQCFSIQFFPVWKELESFSASLIANLAPKTYVPENGKSGTYKIFLQIFHPLRGKYSFTLLHFSVFLSIEAMSKITP